MILVMVILGILLCVALSAFFSGAEMALSSCNEVRMKNEAEDGDAKAKTTVTVIERFDDALGAILIGNNLVNIAASSLGSVLILLWFGSDEKSWISTALITVLVIIFGETIPKITAKKNANRMSHRVAPAIYGLMVLLLPLIRLTVFLVHLLTKNMKREEQEDTEEAVEELQSIIETAEDEAVLDEDQSELVQAAIDFSDISASEVMTARVDLMAINVESSREELLEIIEHDPYSRIPVYEDSVDHIIGVLYLNHYLKALTEETDPNLRALLMPPCFVYKTMKLPAVLNRLRKAKQHLAIVTDEYGGTLGVITMEDVLEQIVGDIWDESDEVEQEVVERPDGARELDGDMAISDFLALMEISRDDFEAESETLGGWTVERFGTYPAAGDSFVFEGKRITVLETAGLRVEKVLLESEPEIPADEP